MDVVAADRSGPEHEDAEAHVALASSRPDERRPDPDPEEDAWFGDDVVLTSVGVDIGSATTHVAFSRLRLRRQAEQLSTAYKVVERTLLFASPIALTPYQRDSLIDADGVTSIVREAYAKAGIEVADIDTGALILTGEAVKRANAKPIAEALAATAGRFVCATAGPALEATMAAHGSGSVALSHSIDGDVLNIDVGGGSTKFSLINDGSIVATAALEVGGRLIAESGGRVVRLEDPARTIVDGLGLTLQVGDDLARAARWRIGRVMADLIVAAATGTPLPATDEGLWITEPLTLIRRPAALTISGGVGTYVHDAGGLDFGDLGLPIAEGLRQAIESSVLPAFHQPEVDSIRATVLGASQFSVQVSGSTIVVGPGTTLPMHDVPVARPDAGSGDWDDPEVLRSALRRLDFDPRDGPIAVSVPWDRPAAYERLHAFGAWLLAGLPAPWPASAPLIIAFDGDVAYLVGHLLVEEFGWTAPLVCIDAVEVREFDYLDVGALIEPQSVVPLVVKSLVFATPTA